MILFAICKLLYTLNKEEDSHLRVTTNIKEYFKYFILSPENARSEPD